MANPFTFELQGADKLLASLAKADKELAGKAEHVIGVNCEHIVRNAKRDAQNSISDNGRLAGGISTFKSGNITFDVVSNVHYSPYIEFGTGALVNVPAGLEGYAIQFKGKGIREVNLPARPYFFTNYYRQKPIIIEDLKQLLRDIGK